MCAQHNPVVLFRNTTSVSEKKTYMGSNKPARKLPAKIAARWKNQARKEAAEDKQWAEVERKKTLAKAAKDSSNGSKNEVSNTTYDDSAVRSGDSRKKGV